MATSKINYSSNRGKSDLQLKSVFGNGFSKKENKTTFATLPTADFKFDDYPLAEKNFAQLFPFDESEMKTISQDMEDNGYDTTQAVTRAIILDEPETKVHPVILDGNHRVRAALAAQIEKIPYQDKTFDTRDKALEYEFKKQLFRRNLTEGQKAKYIMMFDQLKNPGRKGFSNNSKTGKSAKSIAHDVNMSTRNVEKIRNVLANGDDDTKSALLNDDISVNKADALTNAKKTNKSKMGKPDALEDTSDNPRSISIQTRDMSTQRQMEFQGSEYDDRLIERFKDGFYTGFKEGVFAAVDSFYEKIMFLAREEKSADEIVKRLITESDDLFSDLSFVSIAQKINIPSDRNSILKEFNDEQKIKHR